jgi:hypothetical protein
MRSIFSIHKTGRQPDKRDRNGGRKLGRPRPEHGPKYQLERRGEEKRENYIGYINTIHKQRFTVTSYV